MKYMYVCRGPTGVELAGELHDLFTDVTAKHKGTYPNLAGNTRVILAHGGDSLVPQFEASLRQEALRSLEEKGIEVKEATHFANFSGPGLPSTA